IEARLFLEREIPWDEIAFKTVRETLLCYFDDRRKGRFEVHNINIA
ncbi:MAG TPA: NUDIX hydrolase, partial [Ramlibacter sp.]|nr:NUDIX hydrolase [Ramlibacter sp.]